MRNRERTEGEREKEGEGNNRERGEVEREKGGKGERYKVWEGRRREREL